MKIIKTKTGFIAICRLTAVWAWGHDYDSAVAALNFKMFGRIEVA